MSNQDGRAKEWREGEGFYPSEFQKRAGQLVERWDADAILTAFAASEVSRATKELQAILEIRSIEVRNEEQRTDVAESKLAALQEQVKALRETLDAAQTFAEELSDVEANENRYSHAAVATTIAVRISELRTALSQVPAQREQDNG